MKPFVIALAFTALAVPAAAQHENHGAPQAAAQQAQDPARPQPIPPPAKMDDSLPPAQEFVATALAASPRHSEWVDIPRGGGAPVRAFVVYPESKSKTGVVMVVHENRGLNDWARSVADQLAEDGFIAIAIDMLSGMGPNGGHTDSIPADQVGRVLSGLTNDEANKRIDAVREYAIQIPAANGAVGIVGFCWGGSRVFNYAIHQPAIDAGVVYYGGAPSDPVLLDRVVAPLLGLFGEDDARVNTTVNAALPILNKEKKRLDAQMFPGAGHGFLRQQFGREANLRAAERAWPLTIRFFKEHLK
ncbi:MAG TPA: dienelactone hydrolase family protein [Vicinamibacterales bacterium]|nr:dienelactone hydrolase family protein [Vicinamibacterales bacterium]